MNYSLVCFAILLFASFSFALRYELESAHLIGSVAKSASGLQSFSGAGYIVFGGVQIHDHDENEGIAIFSVNIPEDGSYPIRFSYLAASETGLAIHINGEKHIVSKLAASPSSVEWAAQKETIVFRRGLNTIRLVNINNANVSADFLEVDGSIPFAARGATLPFFEIEAEDASSNGNNIGPSRDLYELPTEASGRVAVQITNGQYVEFTLTGPANAMTVRYSIPDTSDGSGQHSTLDVYVNGAKSATLNVSSVYSWAYGEYPFTKNPSDGKQHHFYDEARAMFSSAANSGDKVRVVATSNIVYTIDLADFYVAPQPYAMPAGYMSISDNGADPSGETDSTPAFLKTIAAASSAGQGVWIPVGLFKVNQRFTIPSKTTVRGAGPWWSTVQATVNHGVGFFGGFTPNPSSGIQLLDFAILGDTNVRDDSQADSGVGGAITGGTLVQNLWIEHTKCGMWLDGPFDGLHVTGTIIRNTYADGINFHTGITNSIVEQTIIRNVGDDGLAIWSEKVADQKNTFQFNTIQVPLLANGIALYGGSDNSATDNYVADSICDGGGLQVGNRYQAVGIDGQTTFARNTIVRCGAPSRFSSTQDCGSIWVFQEQGAFSGTVTFEDIDSYDSSYAAATFWDGGFDNTVSFTRMNVYGGPYVFEVNSASGTVPCQGVVAHNLTLPNGGIHSCAAIIFTDNGGNSGWDMDHDHQHCN